MNPKTHVLEVWGDLACFTRPEMKVERFSYPVITPSAARGIFDAIYWEGLRSPESIKPYFYWQIRGIDILEKPRYIALRRNEVKDKVPSDRTIERWMSGREVPEPIWADGNKDELGTDQKGRTQRQTMALKNVRYRLHASIIPKPAFQKDAMKYESIFERRARRGQCFQQPYFGCREFPAFFKWQDPSETKSVEPAKLNLDIGWMLYDVFDLSRETVPMARVSPSISLFQAKVIRGHMQVPEFNSVEVRKVKE
jgi:CRISPR-associated protein Cas5d